MRLVRKIKFKRAKEIHLFKKFESIFEKTKNSITENLKQLNFYNDISELQYFLVLEYVNLVDERVNYNKILPDKPVGSNTIIDFNKLIEEQEKLKNYIQNKQIKGPAFFKNLGLLNEVVGCYLVVTTHKNVNKIKRINLKNKTEEDYVVLKFDFKKLPYEFENLCSNYGKNQFAIIEKEMMEFNNFLNLSTNEQDNILNEMQENIQFPSSFNEENFEISDNFFSTANTIQFAAEKNIDKIYNLEFLNSMLLAMENIENYEVCSKIRDRIFEIKNLK